MWTTGPAVDEAGGVLLADVAAASRDVAATASRTAKLERLAALLSAAAPDEVGVLTSYLAGELRQRRTGVGWRSLQALPAAADVATLTVLEVDAAFAAMGALEGKGSASAPGSSCCATCGPAPPRTSSTYCAALVSGELRQGASLGLVTDAVARAAGVPLTAVRRAVTLCGSVPDVAVAALAGQPLEDFRLQVGRGLSPMLAATATDLDDAWAKAGSPAVVDGKLDGVRVQVHRDGADVRVLTRSLDDVTGADARGGRGGAGAARAGRSSSTGRPWGWAPTGGRCRSR